MNRRTPTTVLLMLLAGTLVAGGCLEEDAGTTGSAPAPPRPVIVNGQLDMGQAVAFKLSRHTRGCAREVVNANQHKITTALTATTTAKAAMMPQAQRSSFMETSPCPAGCRS